MTEHKPDRNKHGRGMYMVRNRKIVDSADMLVAFWDGRSRGTKYTIGYARKQGVSVEVVEYSG